MNSYSYRYEDNVEGAFYVDKTCTDCDLCNALAPTIFGSSSLKDHSICIKQPSTISELEQALEAMEASPCASISCDGPGPLSISGLSQNDISKQLIQHSAEREKFTAKDDWHQKFKI